ncbi:phage/plasmid replication protein, partial [Vibrio anguillarum]
HVSIAHQLLEVGAVNTLRKANTTMSYFTLWQNGTDLRQVLNQSQFYEHKSRLKKVGIDIGQPFDVTRMCPTLRRSEVIEVKPLSIPSWYQLPVVAKS